MSEKSAEIIEENGIIYHPVFDSLSKQKPPKTLYL
jgi:hypothetical protein